MKKYILDFFRRGAMACGVGPLALAVLYLIIYGWGGAATLTGSQVSVGIFSITVLAFLAGGLNVVYQIDRLPLLVAIFIHGAVLYGAYLVTYLLNGWLEWGALPILIFSGIFVVGYIVIWIIISSIIKRNTRQINEKLKRKQESQ